MTNINTIQKRTLKDIVKRGGKVDVIKANYNLRTVQALVRRDFAKLTSNKKGNFVIATAKGKKLD